MLNTEAYIFVPDIYCSSSDILNHDLFRPIVEEAQARLGLYPSRGVPLKCRGLHPTRTILTMTDGSRMTALQYLVHTLSVVDGFPTQELQGLSLKPTFIAIALATFEAHLFDPSLSSESPCDYVALAERLLQKVPVATLVENYFPGQSFDEPSDDQRLKNQLLYQACCTLHRIVKQQGRIEIQYAQDQYFSSLKYWRNPIPPFLDVVQKLLTTSTWSITREDDVLIHRW